MLFVEDHYIEQENNSLHYDLRRVESHDVAHIAVLWTSCIIYTVR